MNNPFPLPNSKTTSSVRWRDYLWTTPLLGRYTYTRDNDSCPNLDASLGAQIPTVTVLILSSVVLPASSGLISVLELFLSITVSIWRAIDYLLKVNGSKESMNILFTIRQKWHKFVLFSKFTYYLFMSRCNLLNNFNIFLSFKGSVWRIVIIYGNSFVIFCYNRYKKRRIMMTYLKPSQNSSSILITLIVVARIRLWKP